MVSREKALALAVDERNGKYHLNYSNPGLQAYRNNLTLKLEGGLPQSPPLRLRLGHRFSAASRASLALPSAMPSPYAFSLNRLATSREV